MIASSLDAGIAPQADEEVAPGVVRVLPMLAPDLDAEGVDPASDPLGHDLRLLPLRAGPAAPRVIEAALGAPPGATITAT